MITDPLISIIIPCYNAQNFLFQCVNSICSQSYSNLEVILVDDGSTDNTFSLCKKLAQQDARIVVKQQVNQGVSQARNIGLSLANGEYVMFVDSDDWIDIDTCRDAVHAAMQHDADIVIWSYIREFFGKSKPKPMLGSTQKYFDQDAVKSLQRRIIGLTGSELSNPEHADSMVTVWGKLYRRTILSDVTFVDMSEIGTEDVYFNILVFGKAQSAFYLPKCYYHYRKTNANSLSTAYTYKIFTRWKNLYRRIEEYLECNSMSVSCYQALNNRICLGIIGLGTNLVQSREPIKNKFAELDIVLNDPVYRGAIDKMDLHFLPMKWKVFFFFVKHRIVLALYLMLCIINFLRRN